MPVLKTLDKCFIPSYSLLITHYSLLITHYLFSKPYLAIPTETYEDFFQLPFIQRALRRYQIKLIIYNANLEEIKQWIK